MRVSSARATPYKHILRPLFSVLFVGPGTRALGFSVAVLVSVVSQGWCLSCLPSEELSIVVHTHVDHASKQGHMLYDQCYPIMWTKVYTIMIVMLVLTVVVMSTPLSSRNLKHLIQPNCAARWRGAWPILFFLYISVSMVDSL